MAIPNYKGPADLPAEQVKFYLSDPDAEFYLGDPDEAFHVQISIDAFRKAALAGKDRFDPHFGSELVMRETNDA